MRKRGLEQFSAGLRSVAAGVIVILTAGTLTAFASESASAVTSSVSRLAGADRFATSAAISAATFASGVPVAYVANGYNFPDALSGAPAAGVKGGPVLLSAASSVSSDVQAELIRLKPAKIIVLGGPAAISADLQNTLAQYTVTPGLSITTSADAVAPGVAGAPFKMQLTASGGSGSYAWSATGLPTGLTIDSSQGLVNGTPASTGSSVATVTLTDTATRASTSKPFTFQVPTAMPTQCLAQACSVVDPGVNTIQLTTGKLVSVVRDASGAIASVTTTGVSVGVNDVLVLPVTATTPSGAVDIVQSVTTDATGNTVSTVIPGNPAQAYNSGTLQTDPGAATTPAGGASTQAKTYIGGKAVTDGTPVRTSAALTCDGQVQASADITLTTTLTPTLTAIWAHPLIQLGSVYLGTGGLQTAYVDLTGSISIGFNATISAHGTCTLALPEIHRSVPAGYLGAVVFDSAPTISLTANATIAASTSTTLTCSAGYYYYANAASSPSWHYCQKPVTDPLKLTTATAIVTLAGHLPLTVSLDEAAGITGEFTPGLTATVAPAAASYATLDAKVDASIGACLACIWPDTPAKITLASGTIWGPRRLLTLTTAPPAPTPPPTPKLDGVASISSNPHSRSAYAIRTDGTVWAWGENIWGQLGNGTTDTAHEPVQVTGLKDITSVVASASNAFAIDANGNLWAWGDNSSGQLGNGTTVSSLVPVLVKGMSRVTQVVSYSDSTFVLRSDGTVWDWGSNSSGQLGNGTTSAALIPVQVRGLTNVTQISGGAALKSDGTVWTWGYNGNGELGNGTLVDSAVPVEVSGLAGVTQIARSFQTWAVRNDGTVWAWGPNYSGQLGNGTTTNSSVPVQASNVANAARVSVFVDSVYVLTQGGSAVAWGDNTFGQLNVGADLVYPGPVTAPHSVRLSGAVSEIVPDDNFAYALMADGTVSAWGSQSNFGGDQCGQLGNGTYNGALFSSVKVLGLTGVVAVAGGESDAYALRNDGTVWAWGCDSGSPSPVQVGG